MQPCGCFILDVTGSSKLQTNGFTALMLLATVQAEMLCIFRFNDYIAGIEDTMQRQTKCAKLLLKAGAHVIILKILGENASRLYKDYSALLWKFLSREFLDLLLRAGEALDYCYGERIGEPSTLLPIDNRNKFVLAELCRTKIRKHLLQLDKHSNLIVRIPQLELPTSLTEYLLYGINL